MISSANKQATKMVHVERVDRLNVSLFLLFQFSYEHVSKMRLFGLCACVRTCTRVCMRARRVCVCVCALANRQVEKGNEGVPVSHFICRKLQIIAYLTSADYQFQPSHGSLAG